MIYKCGICNRKFHVLSNETKAVCPYCRMLQPICIEYGSEDGVDEELAAEGDFQILEEISEKLRKGLFDEVLEEISSLTGDIWDNWRLGVYDLMARLQVKVPEDLCIYPDYPGLLRKNRIAWNPESSEAGDYVDEMLDSCRKSYTKKLLRDADEFYEEAQYRQALRMLGLVPRKTEEIKNRILKLTKLVYDAGVEFKNHKLYAAAMDSFRAIPFYKDSYFLYKEIENKTGKSCVFEPEAIYVYEDKVAFLGKVYVENDKSGFEIVYGGRKYQSRNLFSTGANSKELYRNDPYLPEDVSSSITDFVEYRTFCGGHPIAFCEASLDEEEITAPVMEINTEEAKRHFEKKPRD